MLLVMFISLYTSRVVLNVLGVVDFGLYNVVGGVVVMFSFVNYAMTNSTQRYITYAIGRNDAGYLRKVFNVAVLIHIGIALLIVLLAESIGMWFLMNKMTIPSDRIETCFWVYQFSVIGSVLTILNVPYISTIVAQEDMGIYAYMSIFEAIMRLIAIISLSLFTFDILLLYALCVLLIQVISFCIYRLYCKRKYIETRLRFYRDKTLIAEMTIFAGWSMVGNLAAVFSTQGVNILLNTFFGPIINAARGVATQVQGAIVQISSNFQMALNPQITKSYAVSDMDRMRKLVITSSKISFFLILIISLPVFIEAPLILDLWLVNAPDYSVSFIRIVICIILIEVTADSLAIANQATGKVRTYQTVVGSCNLMIIPISYLGLRFWPIPELVLFVNLMVSITSQMIRIFFMKFYISLDIMKYFKEVYGKGLMVILLSSVIPTYIYFNMSEGIIRLIIIITINTITVIFTVLCVGLTSEERIFLIGAMKKFLHFR